MKRIAPGKKVISFRYTIMSLRTAKKKKKLLLLGQTFFILLMDLL